MFSTCNKKIVGHWDIWKDQLEDRLHTSLETLLSNPPFIHCTNPESGWPKVRRRVITVVDNHNGHCETVERIVLFVGSGRTRTHQEKWEGHSWWWWWWWVSSRGERHLPCWQIRTESCLVRTSGFIPEHLAGRTVRERGTSQGCGSLKLRKDGFSWGGGGQK